EFRRVLFRSEIVIADGCAAQRDDNVRISRYRLTDRGGNGVFPVGRDAEIKHPCAYRAGDGGYTISAGGDDLVGAGFGSERNQFVAGGDDSQQRLPEDRKFRLVCRGGQRKCRRIEKAARLQQDVALAKIETFWPDMAGGRRWLRYLDPIVFEL